MIYPAAASPLNIVERDSRFLFCALVPRRQYRDGLRDLARVAWRGSFFA